MSGELNIFEETITGGTTVVTGTEFQLGNDFGGSCAVMHSGTSTVHADLEVKIDDTNWHKVITDVSGGSAKTGHVWPGTWRFSVDTDDGNDHTLYLRKSFPQAVI